jgi:outer membrane immunogenic protein
MKKQLLGSAALVLLAMPAIAADMPVKAPMIQAAPPLYRWTGCYIGGNVGGGWTRTEHLQVAKVGGAAIVPPNNFGTSEDSDVIGGAQIGCDYQMGSWVIGGRGMFDFGNIRTSNGLPAFPGFTMQHTTKNLFTATGRLGFLLTPQLLAYAQGGGAWARTDTSVFTPPPVLLSESAIDVSRSGWTVGGGLEWMFMPSWSVFAEYNYMDFGRRDVGYTTGPLAVGAPDVIRTKLTAQQALVGINFRFNVFGP